MQPNSRKTPSILKEPDRLMPLAPILHITSCSVAFLLSSSFRSERAVVKDRILQRKNIDNMLYIFGSAFAFLLSWLYYSKPRIDIYVLLSNIYVNLVYLFLICEENITNIVNLKYNKVVLPHMPQKIAIVTGGSRGIGASVTKMLLQCDMEVIIACRTPSAGEKLINKIRESGITSGKAKVYQLDNASLESVHQFANKIKLDYNEIHILINNAGILFSPYEETKEGLGEQWAVNYLSHFLLTALLLPLFKAGSKSGDYSRVVNVSSSAHRIGSIQLNDGNSKERFNRYTAYGESKLAQVISTKTLQDLFQEKQLGIKVYAVHPGLVETDILNDTYIGPIKPIIRPFLKTKDQGATPIVYAAVSEKVKEHGGIYISNCKEESVHSLALDKSIQERLHQLSLDQAKLKDFFQYLK